MAKFKKTLRRTFKSTLIAGIILSLAIFGTGIASVTAAASCPMTNAMFGNFGGLGNFSNSGNSGNFSNFGTSQNPLASLFSSNSLFSQNSNSCNGGNCATGNCPTGNCANQNFANSANNSCATGNCTTGNCPTGNCANNNTCTTGNCANSNNCSGNACLTDCTNCNNCADCPECPQCEDKNGYEPAQNAFELKKGYTYSLKVQANGNRNLVVNCSDANVISCQLRPSYSNDTAIIYIKARNPGNATVKICPANNPNACETVDITVKGNASQSQHQNQTQTQTQNQNQNQTQNNATYAEEVLKYVNEARAAHGLTALQLNDKLNAAATVRANEIGAKFSHTRPNGTSCFTVLREYGISYSVCGENIASGYPDAKSVVNAWMNSSGHRANILNPNYKYMGIGKTGNNWGQFFTA